MRRTASNYQRNTENRKREGIHTETVLASTGVVGDRDEVLEVRAFCEVHEEGLWDAREPKACSGIKT